MNVWKVWIEKFRSRRLSFTFAILATLSAGILIGSDSSPWGRWKRNERSTVRMRNRYRFPIQ